LAAGTAAGWASGVVGAWVVELEAFEEVGLLLGGLGIGGGDESVELFGSVFGEDVFGALHERCLGGVLVDGFGSPVSH
jgi:hypothetical protein